MLPLRPRQGDGAGVGMGDWSDTGTFLRKPASGWLHEDRELMDGSSINYEVQYLGSIEVNQSMRTLKFGVRTQVTKEAILRLAEKAGSVYASKKRKVPKQINKLLGAVDSQWCGNVNLSICVEDLRICGTNGMVIMKHSLPSISFASGGDGPTVEFIGYVAKDPVHGRACHVFDCTGCSQYVLSSIGQAFELRYKIYLSNPRPNTQPVLVEESLGNDAWGSNIPRESTAHIYDMGPGEGTPPTSPPTVGIYSDVPEFPPPDTPPAVPDSRPRVYSNLPGFPPEVEVYDNGQVVPRLENPYDTMVVDDTSGRGQRKEMVFSETGEYSNPDGATGNDYDYDESSRYSNRKLMSIRQISSNDSSHLIDLTPPPVHHDYTNIGPNGEVLDKPSKPSIAPKPKLTGNASNGDTRHVYDLTPATTEDDIYDNQQVEKVLSAHASNGGGAGMNLYDDPQSLDTPTRKKTTPTSATPSDTYDDPDEIMSSLKKGQPPPIPVYDNPNEVVDSLKKVQHGKQRSTPTENVYDVAGETGSGRGHAPPPPFSPKFDDTIYMSRGNPQSSNSRGGAKAMENMSSVRNSLPEAIAPLPQQRYFHGAISRVESEALLVKDGEFLIRESSKKPGQFVLTGMANGQPQHLLLMDKQGKVKSKDHEFESIPHLVSFFTERSTPLVIGNSQVYLNHPVINAYK